MSYYLLVAFVVVTWTSGARADKICFGPNFSFGVATAAYQIEGAWNVSGKGENIWDHYTHSHPEHIKDRQTGDVADDSYNRYKDDVAMLAALNVNHYRFSISWTRILPEGLSNKVNPDGIRYYRALLMELERHRIVPIVTMYHWDLPQSLQDLGGWTNPIIINYFMDYAKVLFAHFGDKVKHWITFNEPYSFCHDGYGGWLAPGANATGVQDYMCGHNVIIAHARVYKLYKEYFKGPGYVGITLDIAWLEPNTTSIADRAAAERARQFNFGWFANPIFSSEGDYPPVMRQRIDEMSRRQGYPRSRLPHFSADEIALIRGSFDFMGVNHYTTRMVSDTNSKMDGPPSYDDDMGVEMSTRPDWPKTNSSWLRVVPWGFTKALNWIRETYNNPVVLITENGVSLEPGTHDTRRVHYIASYLSALRVAMLDGCNVQAYTYWSLMDNFEWNSGFTERFGLYEVDYTSPERRRTPRLSASFYSQVARSKCLPANHYYRDYINDPENIVPY